MMNLRIFFLVAICAGCLSWSAAAKPPPEVSRYAWVYDGAEGASVTIVRVGHPDLGTVLMQITGVDHPLDGAIIKYKVVKKFGRKQRLEYVTELGGQKWVMLVADGHLPGRRQFFLFLPKEMKFNDTAAHGRALSYNKASSARVDAFSFAREYERKHAEIRR